MAGGQERILRRRIKTRPVDEEDHARDGAHRREPHRQGAGSASPRRGPYSEQITEVVAQPRRGRRRRSTTRCSRRATEVRTVALRRDRRRPRAVRRLQLVGHPRRRAARCSDAGAQGRDYALVARRPKAESYFRFRDYRSTPSFTGFSDSPTYEDARAGRRRGHRAVPRPASSTVVQLVYTRFLSAGTPGGRASSRCMPLEPRRAPTAPTRDAGEPQRRLRVRAGARRDPRRAAAALRREPRVFAALLDAAASEHAARQRAMKSATDNADELITTPAAGS